MRCTWHKQQHLHVHGSPEQYRWLRVQVLKENPDNRLARDAERRLTPVVAEQREKLKDEMLGMCCIQSAVQIAMHSCAEEPVLS
jgi:hypothetical protein